MKCEPDAEECVNDTYLAAWNAIPPERPDPLRTYIFRITRNIATAKYHANTALKRNSYYDVALEQEVDAKELSQEIDRFLDSLDQESRVMFVARYWYSDSITEIAKRLRTTNNNVSVRLSRIRSKLKNHLQKAGYDL